MIKCSNRYNHYEEMLQKAIQVGYKIYNCSKYYSNKNKILNSRDLFCVVRHDVDFYEDRVVALAEIEERLNISSTYFFRIHANEYNPLSYNVINIIKTIHGLGHEIGLHAEPLDIKGAVEFDPTESLILGKQILESIIQEQVVGIASHNDPTPFNNLSFLNNDGLIKSLGFKYEAYSKDFELFYKSYYVSDSHPWFWKTYKNGQITDNQNCLCKHIDETLSPLYALIHPHMWYSRHFNLVKY